MTETEEQTTEPKKKKIKLSPREKECLEWAAKGKTAVETGLIIGISRHTVEFHRKSAMSKLDTCRLRFAIFQAYQRDLIQL